MTSNAESSIGCQSVELITKNIPLHPIVASIHEYDCNLIWTTKMFSNAFRETTYPFCLMVIFAALPFMFSPHIYKLSITNIKLYLLKLWLLSVLVFDTAN